ncbi:endonuclease/exonuclease/phosphatase family protein [Vibrio salinus]|uniref:endonuclease/exonuclease/phosphatase family protein n=1 Tax=Vibrio salinus TaxID=2899784 RepID=UPI001E3A7C47|nr:endonuclease/exonuclease/phosphatase family protein [Vibrio salinus]MCE0495350.1 endonuclease/exonuclease/phosphatase family protein [Vibrio salinus]
MKKFLFILLFVPLLTFAEQLRIATWNMEWLDQNSARPESLRTRADYAVMHDLSEQLAADIIAFQEVADQASLTKVLDKYQYKMEFSTRKDEVEQTSSPMKWHQFVGLAIRKGISYERNPDLTTLDVRDDKKLRYGVDVTILKNNKPVIRVLSVHLKSGCFYQDRNHRGCEKLAEQVSKLELWIDARATENIPFIVLGDFNRQLTGYKDWFWKEIDDGDPAGMKLYSAAGKDKSRCQSKTYDIENHSWSLMRYENYIDHIVLDEQAIELMVPESFKQFLYHQDDVMNLNLSDHCPIRVTLQL